MSATPFNFRDLDDATCKIMSAGVGKGPGYLLATAQVYGKVWFFDFSKGKCMYATKDFFHDVNTSGADLQFGYGASIVGGPLIRVK